MIETEFTPISALIGGSLIGLSSVMLMALRGNVLGATGILAGFMSPTGSGDWAWRAAILAGMVTGPLAFMFLTGALPVIEVPATKPMMVVGGILVGIGVTYGSGCTSGHGVCGVARFSRRSIVATATFMTTTALTVFVVRHLMGG
jgi:hypothetical protein